MSERKLKQCPFCGGEAKIKVNESTLNTLITCQSCNVAMKNNFKGHKRIKKTVRRISNRSME